MEFLICKSYDNLKSASNKPNNFGPNPSDNFIDVGMKEADDSKIFTALESSDKITSVLVTDDKEEAKKSPCELMRSPSKSSPSKSLHDENELVCLSVTNQLIVLKHFTIRFFNLPILKNIISKLII